MFSENTRNIPCIIKPIVDSWVIWFQNSRSFLLAEEPVFRIFELYKAGNSIKKITAICSTEFGHLESTIEQFVFDIIQQIKYYNDPKNIVDYSQKKFIKNAYSSSKFFTSIFYKFGTTVIEIQYETEYLKYATHPLFAHLETTKTQKYNHVIQCFEAESCFVLHYNNQLIDAFKTSKVEYYTAAVKKLIYSLIYQFRYEGWMAMLHSSGVNLNGKAILFSAAAGSGKSTIAAVLKANGFEYVSDDIIGTDSLGNVYPFPAAISVKPGSEKTLSKFYPQLQKQKSQKSFIGKTIKYIPVYNIKNQTMKGIKVASFIFINYSESAEFNFQKTNKKKALQLLLKETWVNPEPKFIRNFLNWIEKTEFYSLDYSNTTQAIDVIKNMF